MNYENFKQGFNKPTIITAQQYGTKVSVEIDHSDTSIDELFDAFQTICIGLGYHENSFKNWITQRAEEYIETDAEELKEKLEAWKFESDDNDVRHSFGEWSKDSEGHEDYSGQFKDWAGETPIEDDEDTSNKRMDIIGQNGNEGLHYRATEEDEAEFDDYGMRIPEDRVGFEWGDEAEDDDDELEWPNPNQELIEASKKYKKALKTLSAKQKKKSK
jgi:hypothetical protein